MTLQVYDPDITSSLAQVTADLLRASTHPSTCRALFALTRRSPDTQKRFLDALQLEQGLQVRVEEIQPEEEGAGPPRPFHYAYNQGHRFVVDLWHVSLGPGIGERDISPGSVP